MFGKLGTVAVLGLVAGLVAVPVPGLSGDPAAAVASARASAEELAPVMLVLDASGSMRESAGGGVDKMTAARRAVRTLVRAAPDGTRLGLTVYGSSTGNSGAEKAAGCQDVRLVHPVGPVDREALLGTTDQVRARGYTPIGRALRVAADGLPAEGPRSIVLVSDGIDSCAPPDPCEVARELARQGVDLRVHAVGFDVDRAAQRQLACIARATRGTYTDAGDAAELARALNRVTQQALRRYEAAGTPVSGGTDRQSAPALVPGSYLDDLDPGQVRHYAVEVTAGFTLYASAAPVLSRGVRAAAETTSMQLYAPDGTRCGGFDMRVTATDPISPASRTWTVPLSPDGAAEPCRRPGRYVVAVSRQNQGGSTAPLELLIGLEPPVPDRESAGPAPGPAVRFTTPGGDPRPVVGGGSFHTAATLDGTGSYQDTVWEDEFVFYRVRLDWGQGLAYRVRYGAADLDLGLFPVGTNLYTPSRQEIGGGQEFTVYAYDGRPTALPARAEAYTTRPIRYLNRTIQQDSERERRLSVAGWHYLAVKVGTDRRSEPAPVPVTLDVVVVGTAEAGPRYPGGSDAFGSAPSTPPGSSPSPATSAARAGNESGMPFGPVLWVGVPLLVTIGAGLVVALLLRRRRTPAPPSAAPSGHPGSPPPGPHGTGYAPWRRPDTPPDL
ncbi:vWA domain-containing protein [Plantactinospora sp. CA-290183]|uniref:vWA domain-containing protein n=1 Tax=Plantactinospora sp. CA-290183 TaxID=3240006 RepID=UPI003D925E94